MRHRVFCEIDTHSCGSFVRRTSQNSGRKKIDEVYIHINADTDVDSNKYCMVNVDPGIFDVKMYISGGEGYSLDLTSFKGRIILDEEQMRNVVAELVAKKLPKINLY